MIASGGSHPATRRTTGYCDRSISDRRAFRACWHMFAVGRGDRAMGIDASSADCG
jgi:hypothetical protein